VSYSSNVKQEITQKIPVTNLECLAEISSIFENKANLILNISDVFNTNRVKGYSDINGIYTYNYTKNNSRGISIKFSYQFQTGKKFDNEIRDTSIDDLLNRTEK